MCVGVLYDILLKRFLFSFVEFGACINDCIHWSLRVKGQDFMHLWIFEGEKDGEENVRGRDVNDSMERLWNIFPPYPFRSR